MLEYHQNTLTLKKYRTAPPTFHLPYSNGLGYPPSASQSLSGTVRF